jgi:hypothetical protein
MNRDDIIRMAREAALVRKENPWGFHYHEVSVLDLERFANLVAAAERESMLRDGWRQCAVGQSTTQFCAMTEEAVKAERETCLAILRDMERKKWSTVIHGGEMKGVSLHDAYVAIRARGEG